MALRYSLAPEDQATYGGEEWVTLNVDELAELPAFELERMEKELGESITLVINALRGQATTSRGLRAVVWAAHRQAGHRVAFRDFNIKTLKVRAEVVDVDDDQEAAALAPLDGSPDGSATPGSATS